MKVKLNGNDFYEVSTKFGDIDSWHKTGHTGIDLVMDAGTKLFSPVDGVVSKVVDYGSDNVGKGLFIRTDSGESVIMGHLSDIKVSVGDTIREGSFVALSGNTGRSSGGHLHLGLKDAGGQFVNPQPLLNESTATHGGGIIGNFQTFMDFVGDVKKEGLFHAIYGESFFDVCKDFFSQLFHDIGIFILGNSELLFIVPAIVFMFGTWVAGRNKFTKFIIPLWLAYFFSKFFYYMIK